MYVWIVCNVDSWIIIKELSEFPPHCIKKLDRHICEPCIINNPIHMCVCLISYSGNISMLHLFVWVKYAFFFAMDIFFYLTKQDENLIWHISKNMFFSIPVFWVCKNQTMSGFVWIGFDACVTFPNITHKNVFEQL